MGLFSTLLLAGCHAPLYYYSQNQFAGRAIPPSGLQQRVLATFTANGTNGGAEILDGLRDIRSNIQNTIPTFSISGFTASQPTSIINFPEQQAGYVLDYGKRQPHWHQLRQGEHRRDRRQLRPRRSLRGRLA